MGRWCVVFTCVIVVSCVQSQSIRCMDGRTCPIGTACDEVNHQCVQPDQLTVCIDRTNGETCTIVMENDGICVNEICVAPRCGDELVSTGEQCDASIPAVGTCVDASYDYGVMGCDDACSPSTTTCHRLGWHYVNVPGTGAVGAIWEDGNKVWAATQNGVVHFDGTTWVELAGPTWWVRGIWAGGGHIFAVGSQGAAGVIAHYDGSSWSEMNVPDIMHAVWGRSANEVYAVGRAGALYRFTSTWTKLNAQTTANLYAVWGNAQIIAAVGEAGTVVASMGGSAFQMLRGNSSTETLLGVWGASATKIYAVGYVTTNMIETPHMLHYDGAFTAPLLPDEVKIAGKRLNAITGRSANEIYVAGDGVVITSDGGTWRNMTVPTSYRLNSIHAGTTKVYAAYQTAFFIEFEGAAWVVPDSTDPKATIADIWSDGIDGLVAVGDCAFLEYSAGNAVTPSAWQRVDPPTGVSCTGSCPFLLSVWGSSKLDVYAGGPYGNFFRRVNGTWACVNPRPLGNEKWIWAIWGTGPNDVWVGGGLGNGTEAGLARFNGSTWTDLSTQITAHVKTIRAIWGTGPNNVYFVGNAGAILHYNGSTFTKMQSPTAANLTTLHGFGPNEIYAAGESGTIVRFDGATWSLMPVPASTAVSTTSTLKDLCGKSPSNMFAFGGRTLLHYNGAGWAPVTRPDGDSGNVCLANAEQLVTAGDLGLGSRLVGRLLP